VLALSFSGFDPERKSETKAIRASDTDTSLRIRGGGRSSNLFGRHYIVQAMERVTSGKSGTYLQRGSARISPVSNGWVRAANHSARAAARRRPRSSIGSFKTSSNA
jgi:hypothetical protein